MRSVRGSSFRRKKGRSPDRQLEGAANGVAQTYRAYRAHRLDDQQDDDRLSSRELERRDRQGAIETCEYRGSRASWIRPLDGLALAWLALADLANV